MLQAHDEATKPADEAKLTADVRAELLRRVNPEQNAGMPSFLPLYLGMRVTLQNVHRWTGKTVQ